METTKAGSKTNLNESNVPLLDEKIEMETKVNQGTEEKNEGEVKNETKGKKKKEKKPKECKPRATPFTCAQNCTVGLNVTDRDEKNLNDHVNLNFEDVLAETESNHGFEFFWRLSFLLFNLVRHWTYCVLAAVLSLPFALFWGVLFALLNLVTVWVLTPVFRVFDVVVYHVHKYWNALVRCVLDPFFASGNLLCSKQSPVLEP